MGIETSSGGGAVVAQSSVAWKKSCKVASQVNINLASAPANIDGTVMAVGDRVLIHNQGSAAENGIYTYAGAGNPMARASDSATAARLEGATVTVRDGTDGDQQFQQTTDGITLGISAIVWAQTTGGSDSDWTINGSDQYSAVAGNVGIGITTPATKLHVAKDAPAGDVAITLENLDAVAGSTDETATFQFKHHGIVAGNIIAGKQDNFDTAPAETGYLAFNIVGNGVLTEGMRLAWENASGYPSLLIGGGQTIPSVNIRPHLSVLGKAMFQGIGASSAIIMIGTGNTSAIRWQEIGGTYYGAILANAGSGGRLQFMSSNGVVIMSIRGDSSSGVCIGNGLEHTRKLNVSSSVSGDFIAQRIRNSNGVITSTASLEFTQGFPSRDCVKLTAGKDSDYTTDPNADGNFAIEVALNNTYTERMKFSSNGDIKITGQLGIGTDPADKLHVYESVDGGDASMLLENGFTDTASTNERAVFQFRFGGTAAVQLTATKAEDYMSAPNQTAGFEIGVMQDGALNTSVYLTAAGELGIGGSPDSGTLIQATNTAGSVTVGIKTKNDSVGQLAFGDPEAATIGLIKYDHSLNRMDIQVNATSRIAILSDGKVGIGHGAGSPTSALDVVGDVEIGSANAHYFGDPTTNGSWRITRSGNDINVERRESAVWIAKIIADTKKTTFGSAYTSASVAAAGGTQSFSITDWGRIGTRIQRMQITPSTSVDDYDVEIYREDTHTTKQYSLEDVTDSAAAAVATLDEGIGEMYDDDASGELHVKITNNDPANAATFDIEIEGTKIQG